MPLLVTTLGSAGILALGWFLGATPALDAAALSGESRAAAEAQNTALQAELVALAEQHARVDTIRADVASLRGEVPAGLRLPDLVDQISAVATAHSATLSQFSAEEPISPLTLSAAAQPAAPVEGANDAEDAEANSGASAPAESASAESASATTDPTAPSSRLTATNLFAVPITLTLTGIPADARAALGELQHGERLFFVASTKFSTADILEDSTAEIRGYAYVLLSAAG